MGDQLKNSIRVQIPILSIIIPISNTGQNIKGSSDCVGTGLSENHLDINGEKVICVNSTRKIVQVIQSSYSNLHLIDNYNKMVSTVLFSAL